MYLQGNIVNLLGNIQMSRSRVRVHILEIFQCGALDDVNQADNLKGGVDQRGFERKEDWIQQRLQTFSW